MGIIHFSAPKNLITSICEKTEIKNFIETGTYKGGTALWAASLFQHVYTIEIDAETSTKVKESENCPKNIEFIVGNSRDQLPLLIQRITGRSFFWLDGHWCWGDAGIEDECPLLEELGAIAAMHDAIIFIDDARCFLGPPPAPHIAEKWPKIDEIFALLHQQFPDHTTTIIDDVIISYPKDVKKVIENYWKDTFDERYNQPAVQQDKEPTILQRIINKFSR